MFDQKGPQIITFFSTTPPITPTKMVQSSRDIESNKSFSIHSENSKEKPILIDSLKKRVGKVSRNFGSRPKNIPKQKNKIKNKILCHENKNLTFICMKW